MASGGEGGELFRGSRSRGYRPGEVVIALDSKLKGAWTYAEVVKKNGVGVYRLVLGRKREEHDLYLAMLRALYTPGEGAFPRWWELQPSRPKIMKIRIICF